MAVAVSLAALVFAFILLLAVSSIGGGRRRATRAAAREKEVPRRDARDRHSTERGPLRPVRRQRAARQLCRSFGPTRALDELSVDIAPGEFVAFLGPSGCGKTTALRIIAGLDDADSGQVLVDGKDIRRVPANRRDMGMVFQAYSLFPNMTARDNVAFGLRMRKVAQAGAAPEGGRAARASSAWRRSPTATRTSCPAASSSASRWRAPWRSSPGCCCWTSRCRPSTPRCAASCATRSGASTSRSARRRVFVTHDQEEAFTMADRVAVINFGRLQQIGPPTEIYETAAHGVRRGVRRPHEQAAWRGQGRHGQPARHARPAARGSAPSGDVTVLVRPEAMLGDAACMTATDGLPR